MAIEARHHFSQTHLARAVRRGETPSLVWARTGAQHPELNRVLWFTPAETETSLERMRGVTALWSLWPGTEGFAETEAAARALGLTEVEEEPLMLLPLGDASRGGDSHTDHDFRVRITPCRTRTDLERWAAFWAAEDTSPEDLPRIVAALAPFAGFGSETESGSRPVVTHFLAMHDDTVVGCSAAVVAGRSAAVEHVIVERAWRAQGIGQRLTEAAIDVAVDAGASACVLTASPEGERLYRRLGFAEVCRVRSYHREHDGRGT